MRAFLLISGKRKAIASRRTHRQSTRCTLHRARRAHGPSRASRCGSVWNTSGNRCFGWCSSPFCGLLFWLSLPWESCLLSEVLFNLSFALVAAFTEYCSRLPPAHAQRIMRPGFLSLVTVGRSRSTAVKAQSVFYTRPAFPVAHRAAIPAPAVLLLPGRIAGTRFFLRKVHRQLCSRRCCFPRIAQRWHLRRAPRLCWRRIAITDFPARIN